MSDLEASRPQRISDARQNEADTSATFPRSLGEICTAGTLDDNTLLSKTAQPRDIPLARIALAPSQHSRTAGHNPYEILSRTAV
jgi:hypothetical protein